MGTRPATRLSSARRKFTSICTASRRRYGTPRPSSSCAPSGQPRATPSAPSRLIPGGCGTTRYAQPEQDGLRWLLDRAKAATAHAVGEKKRAAELAGARNAEDAAAKRKAEDAAEAATEQAKDAKRRAEKIEKRGWVTWPEAYELAAKCLAGTSSGRQARHDAQGLPRSEQGFQTGSRRDVSVSEATAHNPDRGA